MASSYLKFLDHTQRRTTVGRTPLDEWSARRRDLYLTTHNTHKRPLPDNTQHSQQTDIHATGGIRIHNLSRGVAADLRLRPRGYQDRLMKDLHTYLITPWSRVLLEKLIGSQQVKKFSAFYGTRRFITAFTRARHLSLSWPSSIQSMLTHPTSW
jgi:hypothetical protein